MNDQVRQTEIAELRQWIDWLAWRVGELERQEAEKALMQQAQTYAPPPAQAMPPIQTPPPPAHEPPAYTAAPAAFAPPAQQPVTVSAPTTPYVPTARKSVSLEDLLSPERLAWAGGVMLLAGIGFLVSWGIHKGWITPTIRIVGAAIVSAGLGGGALMLRERGDKGAVPLAMAAVSVSGMFATLTSACHLYDMIPSVPIALALATLVAATGVLFALRWNSQLLGALALLGALIAPALVDAPFDGEVFGFTLIAYTATMVLCATRRWRYIVMVAAQIALGLAVNCLEDVTSTVALVAAWSSLWAATQIGAFAFSSGVANRALLSITLLFTTFTFASAGTSQLHDLDQAVADGWLVGLAVAHMLLALLADRLPGDVPGEAPGESPGTAPNTAPSQADTDPASTGTTNEPAVAIASGRHKLKPRRIPEIDWILAVALATIAAAQILSGPAVAVTWCAMAAMISWFTHPRIEATARALARAGASGLIGIAVIHVLTIDVKPELLDQAAGSLSTDQLLNAGIVIAAMIAACAVWFWRDRSEAGRQNEIQFVPLTVIVGSGAYLAAVLLDDAALVVALASLSALPMIVTPRDNRSWSASLVRLGGAAILAIAVLHVLAFDAPPDLLEDPASKFSTTELLNISLAIGTVMLTAAVWSWRLPPQSDKQLEITALPFAVIVLGAAHLAALWLGGAPLVCMLAGLAVISQLVTPRKVELLGQIGSLTLITMATLHTLAYEVQPIDAFVDGVPDIAAAIAALTTIAIATAAHGRGASRKVRTAAFGGSALALVYLGSAAIIYALPPDSSQSIADATIKQIGSGQTGQALLSAFWALVAFAAVIAGLRLRIKELRLAGLSLLLIAIGKILLFDLANLDVAYRTISFIVVGAVLLAAAFAFQRLTQDNPTPKP